MSVMQFLQLILHCHHIILSWCFAQNYSLNWKGPKKTIIFISHWVSKTRFASSCAKINKMNLNFLQFLSSLCIAYRFLNVLEITFVIPALGKLGFPDIFLPVIIIKGSWGRCIFKHLQSVLWRRNSPQAEVDLGRF